MREPCSFEGKILIMFHPIESGFELFERDRADVGAIEGEWMADPIEEDKAERTFFIETQGIEESSASVG